MKHRRPRTDPAETIASLIDCTPRTYDLRTSTVFFHADGENGILAPTHPTIIMIDGLPWTSVEAVYQASKHLDPDLRETIRLAPDALTAKAASRSHEPTAPGMGDHSGPRRRVAMARALLLRSTQDDAFSRALKATGSSQIVECDPDGGDVRWGVAGSPFATGWNLQGRLLSAVRSHR